MSKKVDNNRLIIFLDIDGVLNFKDLIFNKIPTVRTKKYNHQDFISQPTLRIFNKLVKLTNAHIVLSSSWRHLMDAREITKFFKNLGGCFEISDITE
jgi:hypothetical protein